MVKKRKAAMINIEADGSGTSPMNVIGMSMLLVYDPCESSSPIAKIVPAPDVHGGSIGKFVLENEVAGKR